MDREERRLRWVQTNRRRKSVPERLGEVAQAVISDSQQAGPVWRRRIWAVLAEYAGPDLLDHMRLVSLRQGVLHIEVQEPAILYHLRLQWERRIVEVLRSQVAEAGIQALRFSVRSKSR